MGMQPPGDSLFYQKVNIPLATDATGWFGTGMNDIRELRHKLNATPRRFIRSGTYRFSIRQIMRNDPLPGVMSAGFRLEKLPG